MCCPVLHSKSILSQGHYIGTAELGIHHFGPYGYIFVIFKLLANQVYQAIYSATERHGATVRSCHYKVMI